MVCGADAVDALTGEHNYSLFLKHPLQRAWTTGNHINPVVQALILSLSEALLSLQSDIIEQFLGGRTGILVLSRILGILLAALAIQFVLNGFTEFMLIN